METLNLNPGDVMLVSAKRVEGGKVSLEFAQIVENKNKPMSLTQLLNESDERFKVQKPRRAWHSGEVADIKKNFGIDTSSLTLGQVLEIGQLNPTINGIKLNLQITETTVGTDYDKANITTRAKRAGKEGEFLYHNGQHIFTKVEVVLGEPNHTFLEGKPAESNTGSVTIAMDKLLGSE
jgi:hypothetical protein